MLHVAAGVFYAPTVDHRLHSLELDLVYTRWFLPSYSFATVSPIPVQHTSAGTPAFHASVALFSLDSLHSLYWPCDIPNEMTQTETLYDEKENGRPGHGIKILQRSRPV